MSEKKNAEKSAAANFYGELTFAIEGLTKSIRNKTLNLISDDYQKSVFLLAQNSDKIFVGLEKGQELLNPTTKEPESKKKDKYAKDGQQAV